MPLVTPISSVRFGASGDRYYYSPGIVSEEEGLFSRFMKSVFPSSQGLYEQDWNQYSEDPFIYYVSPAANGRLLSVEA